MYRKTLNFYYLPVTNRPTNHISSRSHLSSLIRLCKIKRGSARKQRRGGEKGGNLYDVYIKVLQKRENYLNSYTL